MLVPHLWAEYSRLRLRGYKRSTRSQTPDNRQSVSPAIRLLRKWKGEIEIKVAARSKDVGKIERGREDAHYGVRCIIQREASADDAGVGSKASLPKTVTQQYGFRPIPLALVIGE